jgi:WD40 repeat protein
MRLLPRSAKGTWLLATAVWVAACAAAWLFLPPRPRHVLDAREFVPMEFSTDGRILVTSSRLDQNSPNSLQLWNAVTGQEIDLRPEMPTEGYVHGFSHDCRWCVIFSAPVRWDGGNHQLWDLVNRKKLKTWEERVHTVFSPTEALLAVGEINGAASQVKLLDLPTLAERGTLPRVDDPVFSPDGQMIATVVGDYGATVWSTKTARAVATLGAKGNFGRVSFTADNRGLVFSTDIYAQLHSPKTTDEVCVWNFPEARERFRIAGETLVYAGNPNALLTMSNGQVHIHDWESGRLLRSTFADPLMQIFNAVNGAAGGRWLAQETRGTSLSDQIRSWLRDRGLPISAPSRIQSAIVVTDAVSGDPIVRLPGRESATISSNGSVLAVKNDAGQIEIWDLPPPTPLGWFAFTAGIIALPIAWLARRRVRRLRRKAA